LIGSRFNKWLIIAEAGKDAKSNKLVACRCDCGIEKTHRLTTLTSGLSVQCKKCRMDEHNKITNIIGLKFGNSTVLKRVENKNSNSRYLCRCDCGKEREVDGYLLKKSRSTKCPQCRVKTHGMSYTSTFRIWTGILRRCTNQNFKAFKYYGGRGISVCERWLRFENFLADMGERPPQLSIDRINNDGNYEPSNCRWATAVEQRHNQRKGVL
jgi:hypothetical protein